jgi:hypothetical protein
MFYSVSGRLGFFLAAQTLGVFSGYPTGPEAITFHTRELQRVFSLYGTLHRD